jgi:ribosomal protein S18 acetylase RimI-like enzyme
MGVRDAEAAEIDQLATLWHEGWHEAHALIVPAELTRLRTRESFRSRLQEALLPNVRVAGALGHPAGLCIVRGTELYQLYVSRQARGSGVAVALIGDAEARLRMSGAQTAWLACAIGNHRAARFYEKNRWFRKGIMTSQTETSDGSFPLEVWRYEKSLACV